MVIITIIVILLISMCIVNIVLYQTNVAFAKMLAVTKVNMRRIYKEKWVFKQIQMVFLVLTAVMILVTILKMFSQENFGSDNGVATNKKVYPCLIGFI